MTTIRDFLLSTFGDSAKGIEGVDNQWVGGREFKSARLVNCGEGRLQVWCSGECIMSFAHNGNICGCVYLIRDNAAGERWEFERRTKEIHEIGPKPFARLRLVVSA